MPDPKKRRTLSPQFKFKVALEALKGIRSLNEIAAEHQVHPAQVASWKKELLESGSALFERKNARNRNAEEDEERTAQLERALGRAVVEKDFLLKKCKQLGIEP
jgi:transposase-like protein